MLPNVELLGKLLLALHLGLGASKHDLGFCGDPSLGRVARRALFGLVRIHGPDDYEQEPGGLRVGKVRSGSNIYRFFVQIQTWLQVRVHAKVGQVQGEEQVVFQPRGRQDRVQVLHGQAHQGPQALQNCSQRPHQGELWNLGKM